MIRNTPATSLLYRFLSGMVDAFEFIGHCIVVGFTGCLFIAATLVGAAVAGALLLGALGLVLMILDTLHRIL